MSKKTMTGGAGFIGSHVIDLFIVQEYEGVIVKDLLTGRYSKENVA